MTKEKINLDGPATIFPVWQHGGNVANLGFFQFEPEHEYAMRYLPRRLIYNEMTRPIEITPVGPSTL